MKWITLFLGLTVISLGINSYNLYTTRTVLAANTNRNSMFDYSFTLQHPNGIVEYASDQDPYELQNRIHQFADSHNIDIYKGLDYEGYSFFSLASDDLDAIANLLGITADLASPYAIYHTHDFRIHIINFDAERVTIVVEFKVANPDISVLNNLLLQDTFALADIYLGDQRTLLQYNEITDDANMVINVELQDATVVQVAISSDYFRADQTGLTAPQAAMISAALTQLGLSDVDAALNLIQATLLDSNYSGSISNTNYDILTSPASDDYNDVRFTFRK